MMIEKAKLHKTELVESTVAIKKSMQRSFQEVLHVYSLILF